MDRPRARIDDVGSISGGAKLSKNGWPKGWPRLYNWSLTDEGN